MLIKQIQVRREYVTMIGVSSTTINHGLNLQYHLKNLMQNKNIVITGGAGFIGSHLVDTLMRQGNSIIVVDNLFCGSMQNLTQWKNHPHFQIKNIDIADATLETLLQSIPQPIQQIYHLACPASPEQYWKDPIFTLKTGFNGTLLMLQFATKKGARILFTSTSEVYGDPQVSPQTEEYFGNVNPYGPRACYDESKRIAETLCFEFNKKIPVKIARIFNTFGPRLSLNDGRVISKFIVQALEGKPLPIYGDGSQTRSLIYVSDIVDGLIKLMGSDVSGPINMGGIEQTTVLQIGKQIWRQIRQDQPVFQFRQSRQDDPKTRCPDISKARQLLNWSQQTQIRQGIRLTIQYFQKMTGK